MKQGVLNLKNFISYDLSKFIITNCNNLAFKALNEINLYDFLCIFGNSGSGKTHLVNGFANNNQQNCHVVKHSQEMIYIMQDNTHDKSIYLVDDFDLIDNEEVLFHFYNFIKINQFKLIITSKNFSTNISYKTKDLQSRMSTFVNVEIKNPDDLAIEKILEKIFFEHGLIVNTSVIQKISQNIERDFTSIKIFATSIAEFCAMHKKSLNTHTVNTFLKTYV